MRERPGPASYPAGSGPSEPTNDKKDDMFTIYGRARYKYAPTLVIRENRWDDPIVRIVNAELDVRQDRTDFSIKTRHEDGTDVEHDASYLAIFEGGGLQFIETHADRVTFSGALISARYYPEDFKIEDGADLSGLNVSFESDKIYTCDDTTWYHAEGSEWPAGHLVMPFQPPKQKWKAGLYTLTLEFGAGA